MLSLWTFLYVFKFLNYNNDANTTLKNPYQQFLRVMRVWRVLAMLKRSGQCHNVDKYFPDRPPGSVVVPCLACPEPGLNMEEMDQDVDEDMR
jgi:hypothetical protein